MKMRCPVCQDKEHTIIRNCFDDRYGYPDSFAIVSCASCGHYMTTPRLKENELGALYSQYYPRQNVNIDDLKTESEMNVGLFASFKRWLFGQNNQGQYLVQKGQRYLDVGCGNATSLLDATLLGAHAVGVETDPNVERIAKALSLEVHIGSIFDEDFQESGFDVISLNQVLEHVPEPDMVLQNLRKRLAPNGTLTLAFPNRKSFWARLAGVRWINWHIPYHLHHYNVKVAKLLAKNNGFKVVRHKTISPNIWTFLQLRSLNIKITRGQKNPRWSVDQNTETNEGVQGRQSYISKLKAAILLACLVIIALPNRFIDLFGLGESIYIELKADTDH